MSLTLSDLLERDAKLYPEKIAIVYKDMKLSYGQLQKRVNTLAHAFLRMGLKKGDRIAFLLENCPEFVEISLATAKIGAVAVPLNFRLSPKELSYIINNSGASLLILEDKYKETIGMIQPELDGIERFICVGKGERGRINYEQLMMDSQEFRGEIRTHEDEIAFLLYTGGTTGKPKGVMVSHRNLISLAITMAIESQLYAEDVGLVITPLFHAASAWTMLVTLFLGSTLVISRGFSSAEATLEMIQNERVTFSMMMPIILNELVKIEDFSRYDLSRFRRILTGGAPTNAKVMKELMERMDCGIWTGGGQTEGGILSSIRLEEYLSQENLEKLASAGRDAVGMRIRVVNDKDEDVAPGQVGELIGKGPSVMQGYWKMPKETDEALRNGWLHTGDLVKIDEEGYIYYMDRKKDMIISGGENIYSKEVEDAIITHPAVAEVAIIGVPDEKWGESVKALVVLKEGYEASEEEIIEHCKKSIASYKKPKSVEFVDSLPKSGVGKVQKNILRERYWKGYERRVN